MEFLFVHRGLWRCYRFFVFIFFFLLLGLVIHAVLASWLSGQGWRIPTVIIQFEHRHLLKVTLTTHHVWGPWETLSRSSCCHLRWRISPGLRSISLTVNGFSVAPWWVRKIHSRLIIRHTAPLILIALTSFPFVICLAILDEFFAFTSELCVDGSLIVVWGIIAHILMTQKRLCHHVLWFATTDGRIGEVFKFSGCVGSFIIDVVGAGRSHDQTFRLWTFLYSASLRLAIHLHVGVFT